MMRRTSCLLACSLSLVGLGLRAGEIGPVEEFSLAPDRTIALKKLVPGTEDYY